MKDLEKDLVKEMAKMTGKLSLSFVIAGGSWLLAEKNIIPQVIGYIGCGLGWAGIPISYYQLRDNLDRINQKYRQRVEEGYHSD